MNKMHPHIKPGMFFFWYEAGKWKRKPDRKLATECIG